MILAEKDLQDKIQELVDNGAFEIWCPDNEWKDIYIPYMMNDAIECYIRLEGCALVGNPRVHDKKVLEVMLHAEETRFSLVVKQKSDNTYTIFFQQAKWEKKYYRFDGICHFWEQGQEQWGQLVYTIGTMYDKYLFLGEEACNEEEMALMHLVEFAPFRAHAPAKQLFEELYDNTLAGTNTMLKLAWQARDYVFVLGVFLYRVLPVSGLARLLANSLRKESRYSLYQIIYQKTMHAAAQYPMRWNTQLEQMRYELDEHFKQDGYAGKYPDYVKGNEFVRVTEEHPFTIMDWEDIKLRQTLMVSYCNGKNKGFNRGFFAGKGLKCEIIDYGNACAKNN